MVPHFLEEEAETSAYTEQLAQVAGPEWSPVLTAQILLAREKAEP